MKSIKLAKDFMKKEICEDEDCFFRMYNKDHCHRAFEESIKCSKCNNNKNITYTTMYRENSFRTQQSVIIIETNLICQCGYKSLIRNVYDFTDFDM